MYKILLVLLSPCLINGLPRQDNSKNTVAEPKQVVYIVERLENGLEVAKQRPQQPQQQEQLQLSQKPASESQRQPIPSNIPYNFAFLEPQFQYPGFNFIQDKQIFPRVQPQIVFYGPGGQGQPILINPGSPPGNFLVPHQPQPGPNVIIRDTPQRPVFVAGYPKPAHIPPIEKDAEEIPTNPANIPPFPSTPSARKPEKLETFNEGKFDYPTKTLGEDKTSSLFPETNLKPGHRFFILNGEDLFTNFPVQGNRDVALKYAQNQPEQIQLPLYQPQQDAQKQGEIDLNNIPIQALLLRNSVAGQISNAQGLTSEPKFAEQNLISLNQPSADQALFRSSFPINIDTENIEPIGQLRYTPPSAPYFTFDADDIENDAIVIDAKADNARPSNEENKENESSSSNKEPEPSTAQAAPGAIALAGPGGVAGAAPRGTALVGRGGLAVSSPQATAVAGPNRNEERTTTKPNKMN